MQPVLKELMSVKGLILLIALVALGLSITAVVGGGCGSSFGDSPPPFRENSVQCLNPPSSLGCIGYPSWTYPAKKCMPEIWSGEYCQDDKNKCPETISCMTCPRNKKPVVAGVALKQSFPCQNGKKSCYYKCPHQ